MRAALLLIALSACAPRVTTIGAIDAGVEATLTVTGRVCTPQLDAPSFVTKLVVLVDQARSMCVSDPPGSQESAGFCEMYGTVPPGITQPARVRALNKLLDAIEGKNVQVAMVPFETNVMGVWPAHTSTGPGGFGYPDGTLRSRVNTLQAELGDAKDLQGALAYTHELIATDLAKTQATDPRLLPRARYVVVVISDGMLSPRCSAIDTLPTYADDLHPELTWADTTSYCNTGVGSLDWRTEISGFVGGQARNQNAQLLEWVDRLRALRMQYLVGGLELHTVLLFPPPTTINCFGMCNEFFGIHERWPGPTAVPPEQSEAFSRTVGQWLMAQLAARGGGTFTAPDYFGLGTLELPEQLHHSLGARNVLKRLIAQPLRAVRLDGQWAADGEGDGVADVTEAELGLDPLLSDTDGDGFSDRFELTFADAGFDPKRVDPRGCDPASFLRPTCSSTDADGDGLTQWEERYLGSDVNFEDTDRDGFPDGVEVREGLDPRVPLDASTDADGDGLTDGQELMRGSDPKQADRAFADARGIDMVIDEQGTGTNGSTCYTFTVRNLSLAGSLFKLSFASGPEGVRWDLGSWKAACAWAPVQQPAPHNLRVDLQDSAFRGLPLVPGNDGAVCVGMP